MSNSGSEKNSSNSSINMEINEEIVPVQAATMNAVYVMNMALLIPANVLRNHRENLFKKAMDILDDAYNLAERAFYNLIGGKFSFIANNLRKELLELQKKIVKTKNAVRAKVETLDAVKVAVKNLKTQLDKINKERTKIKAGIKLNKVRKSKKARKSKKKKK